MRGGLRSWKRGGDSRGPRNAISYAFGGTCDAHHRAPLGAAGAERYADAAAVTRFTVVGGAIAADELDASALRRWIVGEEPATGIPRGQVLTSENTDLLLDGTINFPKSYSIAALLNPELAAEFEALQDRMRDQTILAWQRELNARRGSGGKVREDLARIEVVELQHRRSRALDPHIHRHLWLNMKVQGVDGKWSSLDSRVAMKFQTVVNAEGELAARTDPRWLSALAHHGYTLDEEGEIAQLAHVVRPLSRRSNKIEANRARLIAAWRDEHYWLEPSPIDLQHIDSRAWAQGRPGKPADLDETEWEDRVRSELTDIDPILLWQRRPARFEPTRVADLERDAVARAALMDADARAVSSSGRFSAWDARAGAIRAVAATGVSLPRAALEELIEDITARALKETLDLTPDDEGKPAHVKTYMATATVMLKLRVDNKLAALAKPGILPREDQVRRIASRSLGERVVLDDAHLAAASAIAGSGGLVSITGPAGAGKTTLLRIARDALALQERDMILVAPTKKAALVAQHEVGVVASSLHALLADHGWRWTTESPGDQRWSRLRRGDTDPDTGRIYEGAHRFRLTPGDRVVVDEAGMIDLHSADALATILSECGAGVALVGDPRQAAPVGHAGAMALATRHADHVIELQNVHRFTDAAYGDLTLQLRRVSTAAEAASVAAALDERGHVSRHRSVDDAQEAMVDAWFRHTREGSRVALVVATNDEANAISEAIQQRRLGIGDIAAEAVAIGRDGQHILVGDIIQTRRNDTTTDVQNRATWIVTGITPDRIGIAKLEDSTERRWIPTDYAAEHAHLAYASTVHGIQGDTVDTSIVGPGVDAAGIYVGLTRGRHWNEAIVIAGTADSGRDALAQAIQRGVTEPTIDDSRRAADIDLTRAARVPRRDHAPGPFTRPTAASRGPAL